MIVLTMIVKDEAHVIRRCLDSVTPFIDAAVILDTGSSDDTFQIVEQWAKDSGVRLNIGISPWKNFAHNRNELLDVARMIHRAPEDYTFTIDADEVLEDVDESTFPWSPISDGYQLTVNYSGTTYQRLALVRLDKPWRWHGVVHEYLHLDGATIGTLTAPTVTVFHDGARSKDPETYRKDAAMLAEHLVENPEDSRAQFYLAQSYRDAGNYDAAVDAYYVRSEMDWGYDAERWHSLWQMGRLYGFLNVSDSEITDAYLRAFTLDSTRAEPLVDLAEHERKNERFRVALMYAREACRIVTPTEGLFIDTATYQWRRWDERALAAYYSGEFPEALQSARRALAGNPGDERLAANVALCEEKAR